MFCYSQKINNLDWCKYGLVVLIYLFFKYFKIISVLCIQGPTFVTCRISVTHVSAPGRCYIYYWRKCLYLLQISNFLGLKHLSLRYNMYKKFGLYFCVALNYLFEAVTKLIFGKFSNWSTTYSDIESVI